MNHTLKKSTHLFALLLSIGLIAGCGAERDTAFNPDTDEEEGVSVLDDELLSADQKDTNKSIDYTYKRLQVFKTQDELDDGLLAYSVDGINLDDEDHSFDDGQVVLIDLGEIDTCKKYLSLARNDVDAQEDGESGVKVQIVYREQTAASSETCEKKRPYKVFYIDSTGPLVFAEDIK